MLCVSARFVALLRLRRPEQRVQLQRPVRSHLCGGGCDQSARWGRKRRVRGERGAETGAPASLLERLPARPVGPLLLPLPNEVRFLPISRDQRGAVWRRNGAQLQILNRQASRP